MNFKIIKNSKINSNKITNHYSLMKKIKIINTKTKINNLKVVI